MSGYLTQDNAVPGMCSGYGGIKHPIPCRRKGTLEFEGKAWCEDHHPPTADALFEEILERERPEREAYEARMAKRLADRNEQERRARAYTALIAEANQHEGAAWILEFLERVK